MRTWLFVLVTATLTTACGSSSPTSPSAPPPPQPVPGVTLTGHLTATNGGTPIPGVTVTAGASSAVTAGDGGFSVPTLPASIVTARLTGASIVPRTVALAATASRDVGLSAIALGPGFDLRFYRSLARNGFESPTALQSIARWTVTPRVYLKTVDEAGEAIHGPTLDLIEATVRDAIPRWTSGLLGVPTVTRGTGTMVGVSGWLTIRFPATVATTFCGQALVGVDGGWVDLSYHVPSNAPINCRVPGAVIAPRVVRHELGHALGFWHTDSASDLMVGGPWTDANQQPSARELAHAAIVYRRPVGNVDPDTDPTGVVSLTPMVAR